MTRIPPEDQPQRHQAINPDLSVHVEAPAGSGKTTVLMKRYLALLAQVKEPEEILALTFTRKAAGELRTRIQNELNKREDFVGVTELPPHEAELRELALAAVRRHADKGIALLERLQISTFHGFCAQLLRLVPHRTGLPPDFGLLDESATKRLQKEAVALLRQRLSLLSPKDPVRQALVRRLVRLNNNWPRLAAELQDLLARRDTLGKFIVLARESRDPGAYGGILRDHLTIMLQPRLTQLAREFSRAEVGRSWPEIYRCLSESGSSLTDTLPAAVPGDGLEDLTSWRNLASSILTKSGECFRRFAQPKFPKRFRESSCCRLLQDLPEGLVDRLGFFREMSSILLAQDEVGGVQDLIILLHQALIMYDSLCSSRRSLDFTALEQIALQVLSDDSLPELWRRLDRRLAHLLVDEFQDTSVNQMHLLCRLLAGWQGDRGRSLMVVGDPKQSIYGWRQARLELFFESREAGRLPACPEAPTFTTLTLKTNFRSTQSLVDWANEVFGQTIMMDRDESGVDFKAAVARPGADPGSPPHLALFTGPEARSLEADWLARELLHLCRKLAQSAAEPETVGVLLFTRTHLAQYLEACRRVGLSPRVRDGLSLGASLAVQYLHNLITALVRPHDNLAWTSLLRTLAGPQRLGLLAEIVQWPGGLWSEKIKGYAAAADSLPEIAKFFKVLTAAEKRVGREPLDVILSDCLSRLESWKKLAAREGPQGIANARAYLELLAATAAPTPEATLAQAVELLAEAYQPPDPLAEDSPLEVLTVHAAKGLEFDHVFLPFVDWPPGKTGKKDTPFLMEEVPGTGTALIALNRSYLQEEPSVLYQTLSQTAKKNALAEARRLFYVAVTRAKKHLRMSGVIKPTASGDWNFTANTPLGWLKQHYSESELNRDVVDIWAKPRLVVTLNPKFSDTADGQEPDLVEFSASPDFALPPIYDIQPEPWPYDLQLPSQLSNFPGSDDEAHINQNNLFKTNKFSVTDDVPEAAQQFQITSERESKGDGGAGGPVGLLRGEICHRLLEILSLGGSLPEPGAIAMALHMVSGSPAAALDLSEEIIAEIKACQADPFLATLLSPDLPVARSEWFLESWDEGKTIYRGQIDRLVYDGRDWWLLDYKTSRPAADVNWEDFMAAEVIRYRPQLLAYREMAARFYDINPPELIRTVLYFTACQRHVSL